MPKVEKVGHDLFSPLHYTCPTPKVHFPYLFWLHQKLPWSFFLYFFFFLLCSYWQHFYLFFDFLKERRLKKLTPSFIPIVQHLKKEKLSTLFSLSHQRVQQQEGSFFQLFSSSCSQLEARVILALSLLESVSRVRGKCNSFSLLFILNLSDGYMILYMGVLDFKDCWLPKYELNHCYACMCS